MTERIAALACLRVSLALGEWGSDLFWEGKQTWDMDMLRSMFLRRQKGHSYQGNKTSRFVFYGLSKCWHHSISCRTSKSRSRLPARTNKMHQRQASKPAKSSPDNASLYASPE